LFQYYASDFKTINYGMKLYVTKDRSEQPIIVVAYQMPSTGRQVHFDLFKPFPLRGQNYMVLWQQKALTLDSVEQLETVQVFPGGQLMWLSGSQTAYTRVFCAANEVFYLGSCLPCPAKTGTLMMQQAKC
jgi:hypothetical protein